MRRVAVRVMMREEIDSGIADGRRRSGCHFSFLGVFLKSEVQD